MGERSTSAMNVKVALHLGRVSNLPTIWTNCLVGALLSNNFIFDYRIFFLLLSMSLLYVSGMFLNDAFDYLVDIKEYPHRPIPSGQVPHTTVFAWGILLMLFGLLCFFLSLFTEETGLRGLNGVISTLALCMLIVFYDWKHKENPFGPFLMGACRGGVYLTAGLVYVSAPSNELILAALMGFLWIVGITFLAKQETQRRTQLWPVLFLIAPSLVYGITKILVGTGLMLFLLLIVIGYAVFYFKKGGYGVAISTLIAAISLLDGLLLAFGGFEWAALLALCMTPFTLVLQRLIPAT